MSWDKKEIWLVVFLVFVFLWLSAWILSYTYFAISTAVVQWYFEPITGHQTQVFAGLKLGIVYHCGSIAFGSFLLMLVWVLKAVTEWVMNKIRKASGNNRCVICLINCVRCCCNCLENFVKFINRHAFTEIVLRSCNFCQGAKYGMAVVASNGLTFAFLNTVMLFMNFILSCGVGAGSACIVHLIVNVYEAEKSVDLQNIGVDIVVFLIGFIIGRLFFTLYGISADVILHCYCHDVKKHRFAKAARPKLTKFVEDMPREDNHGKGDYDRIM